MSAPRYSTLAEWLAWQEQLHPRSMDFTLERARTVLQRLQLQRPTYRVLTVAGTNGKGSSATLLAAILQAAGYRVGLYTSPHIVQYNERVRLNGEMASDAQLCAAFAAIDQARGEISLTYFEFGTLAAFYLFAQQQVEVAVLEVGLGGRLDTVNLLDADGALLTSIGLDHTEWLGHDRDSIGREKAGIMRPQRPAVCSDPQTPPSVREYAAQIGAPLICAKQDFTWQLTASVSQPLQADSVAGVGAELSAVAPQSLQADSVAGAELSAVAPQPLQADSVAGAGLSAVAIHTADSWLWQYGAVQLHLPLPALPGLHQLQNAAGVIALLWTLREILPVSAIAMQQGLQQVRLAGRFQQLNHVGVDYLLDVTHNADGAAVLARCLQTYPSRGRTLAVLGMLADKDAAGAVEHLRTWVDQWFLAGLDGARGRSGAELAVLLAPLLPTTTRYYLDVASALAAAQTQARAGDRILIFGSFHTVAAALASGRMNVGG